MNATKVSDLVHEIFDEAIDAGARDVRVVVRMSDGSHVVFSCNSQWQYRDWMVTPDGAKLDEQEAGA